MHRKINLDAGTITSILSVEISPVNSDSYEQFVATAADTADAIEIRLQNPRLMNQDDRI